MRPTLYFPCERLVIRMGEETGYPHGRELAVQAVVKADDGKVRGDGDAVFQQVAY